MDYELVLNPSNTDLFPDQSMISKSPPYIVKSTLTRPATQPSRPRSVVHVPLHHIVHYSLSSSSGLSPTPPNPQRGRNRHCQPSGESCSSRRRISDWPRSRHSTCSCQQPTRSTWILLLSIQLPSQTGQLPTSSLPSSWAPLPPSLQLATHFRVPNPVLTTRGMPMTPPHSLLQWSSQLLQLSMRAMSHLPLCLLPLCLIFLIFSTFLSSLCLQATHPTPALTSHHPFFFPALSSG